MKSLRKLHMVRQTGHTVEWRDQGKQIMTNFLNDNQFHNLLEGSGVKKRGRKIQRYLSPFHSHFIGRKLPRALQYHEHGDGIPCEATERKKGWRSNVYHDEKRITIDCMLNTKIHNQPPSVREMETIKKMTLKQKFHCKSNTRAFYIRMCMLSLEQRVALYASVRAQRRAKMAASRQRIAGYAKIPRTVNNGFRSDPQIETPAAAVKGSVWNRGGQEEEGSRDWFTAMLVILPNPSRCWEGHLSAPVWNDLCSTLLTLFMLLPLCF